MGGSTEALSRNFLLLRVGFFSDRFAVISRHGALVFAKQTEKVI